MKKCIVVALLALFVVGVGIADAHTLTKTRAARAARKEARSLAYGVAEDQGSTVESYGVRRCERNSRHSVDCDIRLVFNDNDQIITCETTIRVRFISKFSRRTRTSLPYDPECF